MSTTALDASPLAAAPLVRHVRAADLPLEKLAANPSLSDQEKVAELSRQFEAVLLRQILQEGQKTVFPSKLSPDSTSKSIYQDMIVKELADGISKGGTLGLATSLRQQLSHQLLGGPVRSATPVAPATDSKKAPHA